MADPLVELAGRLSTDEDRVERLETLEFSTVAFPAGGAIIPFCDIILAAPAGVVTFCPVAFLQTERHLFFVLNYWSTNNNSSDKMEMNFNGDFGAVYLNYTRQEVDSGVPVGVTDTEVPPIGFGADTKFSLPIPSQAQTEGRIETPTSVFGFIPAYSRTGPMKTLAWYGYTNPERGPNNAMTVDQGGGEYRRFAGGIPPAAIASITMTHAGAGSFATGSRFTLYSLP